MKRASLVSRCFVLLGLSVVANACQAPSERGPNVEGERSSAPDVLPNVAARTKGYERLEGFLQLYIDRDAGRIYFEVQRFDVAFLYVPWLATGLGSNPVGLDRGLAGQERVVRFERHGRRVLLVEENLRYRALSEDDAERATVRESFAASTLWASDIVAEEPGRVLVDATSFVLRDAMAVTKKLETAGQGKFTLDLARSVLHLPRTKAFPRNSEVEVSLTFVSDAPGSEVRQVAPNANAITVRQHHSMVALPDAGYRPRAFHPRSGSFGIEFFDHAAALSAPMRQQWIQRHRLDKLVPGPAPSRVQEPIVYWLDAGCPEPVRSALLEGARWWSEAFAAAGFLEAFFVRVLPPDVDPLDVRYNVIQWTHRATRGWSYGRTIRDPRTGEILKGHVTLGSLRVRQDRRIFVAAGIEHGRDCEAAHGGPAVDAIAHLVAKSAGEDIATEVSLARLRQLAAHEVGHTLGFAHNFAASSRDRASVMDYPAPFLRLLDDGRLDVTSAYASGIGAWDILAVRYAYEDFGDDVDAERRGLRGILDEARQRDLIFITDQDARDVAAAHPDASLWDNGADAVAELQRVLELRDAALVRCTLDVVDKAQPQSDFEEYLVPIYLLHRYQVEACAKLIGGVHFDYADAGEARALLPVPAERQRAALHVLLTCLTPQRLRVPDHALSFLSRSAFGSSGLAERFPRETGATFDEAACARVVADIVFDAVLHATRLARVQDQAAHAGATDHVGLEDVLTASAAAIIEGAAGDDRRDALLRAVVVRAFVDRLFALADDDRASASVREAVEFFLEQRVANGAAFGQLQHAGALQRVLPARVRRFLQREHRRGAERRLEAPPGSPIGAGR